MSTTTTTTTTTTACTSIKDLLRIAAFRNVEGATHLADEELEAAIADFTVAYHCLYQAIQREEDEHEQNVYDDDHDDDDDTIGGSDAASESEHDCVPAEAVDKYHFILDSPTVAWYSAASSSHNNDVQAAVPLNNVVLDSAGADNCFVYNEALVFNPDSATDINEALFCQGVMLFNMALTFHARAIAMTTTTTTGAVGSNRHCDSVRVKSLLRGLSCYNRCLDSIREHPTPSSSSNSSHHKANFGNTVVEAHMLIASLNNKAQTLFALGDYHQTYYVLQELAMVMDATNGHPPGFEQAEVRGLESTLNNLLDRPEITAAVENSTSHVSSSASSSFATSSASAVV